MSARLLSLSLTTAALLCACATSSQENPNYAYSTKYKASSPYDLGTPSPAQPTVQAAGYSQTQAPVTYGTQTYPASQYHAQPVTYTRTNHECLAKEKNRELLGAAIGGTAGAVAGNKTIGGPKGTVIGAVVGGAAGYGIGDKSIDCDPVIVTASQPGQAQPYYSQAPTNYYPSNVTAPTPQTYQPQPQYQTAPQTAQQSQPYAPMRAPVTAPTDQAYGETYGTPGYHAMMAAGNNPVATQPQMQQATPQQYAQPTQPQPAPVVSQPAPYYGQPSPQYMQPVAAPAMPASNGQSIYHEVVEGDTVYSLSKRQCVAPQDVQRLNNLNANFNIRLGDFIQLPASRC